MPLSDLSLDELNEMADVAATLCRVGNDLLANGITPTFDLTPGQPVRIALDAVMPDTEGVHVPGSVFKPQPEVLRGVYRMPDGTIVASEGLTVPVGLQPGKLYTFDIPSTEAALARTGDVTSVPAPEPVDAPPVVKGPAGGAPEPAAPSRSDGAAPAPIQAASSEGVADSGGGQPVMAAAAPPAATAAPHAPAPLPGSASALAGGRPGVGFQNLAWTAEEEDRLITLVVMGMTRLGMTKMAAIACAAHELGRGAEGVKSRCYNQLKHRLDAALAQGNAFLDQPEDQPEPTPSPEAEGDASADRDAAVGGHSPPAVQTSPPGPLLHSEDDIAAIEQSVAEVVAASEIAPAPVKTWHKPEHIANDLTGHLMSLPDKGGWTLERDLELMELSIAGWQPNEIAMQLQVQANLIKPRFDQLTGLYEDATGKKVRRFTREAVFAALTRLIEADAKGAA